MRRFVLCRHTWRCGLIVVLVLACLLPTTTATAQATADSVAAPHWSLLVPPAVSEVAARVVERVRAASDARNGP
mgnify:CR=1 FL=1